MIEKTFTQNDQSIKVSFIPAFFITTWLLIYRLLPRDLSANYASKYLVEMFGIALLIGMISSLLINFFIRNKEDRFKVLQMALPTFVGYLLFSLLNIILTSYIENDHSLEHMWFDLLGVCTFHLPIAILLGLDVVFFGWTGSKLRRKVLGKP